MLGLCLRARFPRVCPARARRQQHAFGPVTGPERQCANLRRARAFAWRPKRSFGFDAALLATAESRVRATLNSIRFQSRSKEPVGAVGLRSTKVIVGKMCKPQLSLDGLGGIMLSKSQAKMRSFALKRWRLILSYNIGASLLQKKKRNQLAATVL